MASASPSEACPASAIQDMIETAEAYGGVARIVLPDAHGKLRETYDGIDAVVLGDSILEAGGPTAIDYDHEAMARLYADWISDPEHQTTYGTTWGLAELMDDSYLWVKSPQGAQEWLSGAGCTVSLSGVTPRDPAVESVSVHDAGKKKVAVDLWLGYRDPNRDAPVQAKVVLYRWKGSSIGSYRKASCGKLDWRGGTAKRAQKVATKAITLDYVKNAAPTLTFKTPRRGCMIAIVTTPGEKKVSKSVRIK